MTTDTQTEELFSVPKAEYEAELLHKKLCFNAAKSKLAQFKLAMMLKNSKL